MFIFIFWSRCCCCCCCVLLLLPTTSVLKRREVPATASSFSVSATTTAVRFASILLLLLRLRRDACRKKQTKYITFSFLVAALLLLFTHREGCAERNKIGFCFVFDTGTQSIALGVVMVVDCAAVETECMLENFIKFATKYVFIFIFWSKCCCY